MEWRNRDWAWLVGILVAVMIVMISIFYSSEKTEVNFAIISSAVSIALALVAIFIALSQSRDNQELSASLKITMSIMNEKLNSVDEKVKKIDPDILIKVHRQIIEEVISETEKEVNSNSEISAKEIKQKYREQLSAVGTEFEELINEINESENFPKMPVSERVRFQVGDEVEHKKWGIGEVLSVIGRGDATEVIVDFFGSVGEKRLLAKFAPIRKTGKSS